MCNYPEESTPTDEAPTLSKETIQEAFHAFVDQDMDNCLNTEFSQDEFETDSSAECDVDSETYLDSEEIPPTKLNHCRYLSAAEANKLFNETVQLTQNKYDALSEDKKPDEFDWRDEIRSQNASIDDIQHSIENEVNRRVKARIDELDNHCDKYKSLLRQRAKKRVNYYRKAFDEKAEELKTVQSNMLNMMDNTDTLNYSTFPANDDILGAGNKPEKKVYDVIDNELRMYKETNDSVKIGRPYDSTVDKQKSTGLPPFTQRNSNAEQCDCACKCKQDGRISAGVHFDASVTNDLPKSMVDKIVSIPGEYWRYYFSKGEFELTYTFKTRTILLTFNIDQLNSESNISKDLLTLDFNNNGLGELSFKKKFVSEQDINQAGPNSKRLYAWLIQIINSFFLK